jgi:hypothetical protein
MMQATSRLHQPASRSLSHERIRGKREGICLQDAGPRGEKALYKVATVKQGVKGQRIMPKTRPRRSRQLGSRPPNL